MRLGVLDVSNTGPFARGRCSPWCGAHSAALAQSVLRLAEHIDKNGDLSQVGADALVGSVLSALHQAKELECEEILAFATSAVRDARNCNRSP